MWKATGCGVHVGYNRVQPIVLGRLSHWFYLQATYMKSSVLASRTLIVNISRKKSTRHLFGFLNPKKKHIAKSSDMNVILSLTQTESNAVSEK